MLPEPDAALQARHHQSSGVGGALERARSLSTR
jgi:hypothetical protein